MNRAPLGEAVDAFQASHLSADILTSGSSAAMSMRFGMHDLDLDASPAMRAPVKAPGYNGPQ